jgi:hypothetical protein
MNFEAVSSSSSRARARSWRRDVEGIRVLKVSGSFREMGRQHGALLKDEVRIGPVPYFRTFIEKLMGGPRAGRLVWTLLQRSLGAKVARAMPDFAVETLRGMAEGAALPFQDLMDGCTMPDTLMWLVARTMKVRNVGPAVSHRIALELGCTSAIAWGSATKDGKLVHARNFDYHGVSCWPRTQAVIFHEPDDGQRYVSVSAAGVPLGGITAMNEAGLTLTVHQHMFTDRTRFGGTPIGTTGDVVMRKARSLDDAERILASQRPIGCWTYVIGDGNRHQVLCWEENPDRHVARRETGGIFGYANVYLDRELGKTERYLYGNYWRHNRGRHERAWSRLRAGFGRHDARSVAAVLADAGDPRCRVRDSIAMVLTVASVVFRPEDGVLWIASGEAPTSHGTFVPFSLEREDHAPEHGTFEVGDVCPEARQAFEHYRRAYVAYMDDGDATRAREEADKARSLQPDQCVYHALFGLLSLVLGDSKSAEAAFDRAITLGHPDQQREASLHLWRGRARDVSGDREKALDDYRHALGLVSDPPVAKAAKKGLRKPFHAKRASSTHVEMIYGDVIHP